MVRQILKSDAANGFFGVQASDKFFQNALTAISDTFHENKELSLCRVDKQIPNHHPKSLRQLGIPARDLVQIALKYRAYCLRSIFCLNVGILRNVKDVADTGDILHISFPIFYTTGKGGTAI